MLTETGFVDVSSGPLHALPYWLSSAARNRLRKLILCFKMAPFELVAKFYDDLFNGLMLKEMEVLWSVLKKLYCFDREEQDGFEAE